MKKPLILLFTLIPFFVFTQSITISTVYDMDITNIDLKTVVKAPSGYYGAKTGTKFLVIEGLLKSKVPKRVQLPLYKMFIKTETDSYMGLGNPSYIPFSEKDRFIRFKKKTKKPIYFIVDENFKEGVLIFDYEKIGTIKMTENGISAVLIPHDEE